jgi:hypothetical protein
MPRSLDHTYKGEKTKKVSNLNNFLEYFFKLLNDKNVMVYLKICLRNIAWKKG